MMLVRNLLCSLIIAVSVSAHNCIHDKIASHSIVHKFDLEETRLRIGRATRISSYGPIRVKTYLISKFVNKAHRRKLQDKSGPLHRATKQLRRLLQVKRLPQILFPLQCSRQLASGACLHDHVIRTKCGSSPFIDIPLVHMSQTKVCYDSMETNCTTIGGQGLTSTDLIIYVTAINHRACGSHTLAYASHCVLDHSASNRPVAGVINICAKNFWKTQDEDYHYKVLLHEITHILVFSDQLYPHFVNARGNSVNVARRSFYNGQEIVKLITPQVVSWGRQYFDCNTLEGVPLQPSPLIGLLGSHWSHLLLEDEYMSPAINQITGEVKLISNLTLFLLQDSGWYRVNFDVTKKWLQPNKFRGGGCDIISETCPTPCSFNNSQWSGCSYNGLSSAKCGRHTLTLNCPSFQASSHYACTDVTRRTLANHNKKYEVLGNQSRCFVISRNKRDNRQYGYCLRHQCYQTSHTHLYALQVFIPQQLAPHHHGSDNSSAWNEGVWCRAGAQLELAHRYGNITCPDAAKYCSHSDSIININYTPPSLCHESCATCFKPFDPTQCNNCHYGYKLNGNFPTNCLPALTKCWGSSYYDNTTNSCHSCPEGCAICTSSANCLHCSNHSHYLTNGNRSPVACVESCEEVGLMSYTNLTNHKRVCYVCAVEQCVECGVSGRCSKCQTPYKLYDGRCVLNCPEETVTLRDECYVCPNHCKKCSNPQWCNTCQRGYLLSAGFCVVKCPSTFYSSNSTHCKECSDGCAYCTKASSCRLCNTGYHSYKQHCVKECPSGYFRSIDPTKRQLYCRACDQLRRLLRLCT